MSRGPRATNSKHTVPRRQKKHILTLVMRMFEFETKTQIGEGDCQYEGAISFPIFQTSTFRGGGEFSYTRVSNPTRKALEKAVAELEGGEFGFAFSTGLGAVNAVFSLLKSGDRVLLSDDIYGGTYRLVTKIFEKYGIDFEFTDMTDLDSFSKKLYPDVKMVFAETPTNPMMKIADIRRLGELCHEVGGIFVVDNTFLSPYFQNPLPLGADIVLHSGTKFLSGHHDASAGFLVTNHKELAARLELISMTLGNALSPFESWLVLRGLRTLSLRMEKHQENAFRVANFLETHPSVEKVIYPGLKKHEGFDLCSSQSRGFGGVVSFAVKENKTAEKLLKGGKIIKFAESLGGFRSLITYPLTQTHASVPEKRRQELGITDKLFRLSVGLENAEDIIRDLQTMLE